MKSKAILNSQLVPPGYKQTEVGVIPEDWEVKPLGSIASIVTGSTPPTRDAANYGDEFLFVSPVDLGFSKYILRTEKMLSKKGVALLERQQNRTKSGFFANLPTSNKPLCRRYGFSRVISHCYLVLFDS